MIRDNYFKDMESLNKWIKDNSVSIIRVFNIYQSHLGGYHLIWESHHLYED